MFAWTIRLMLILGIVAAVSGPAQAQKRKEGFVTRTYKGDEGQGKYVVFVPHGYDTKKIYPVILYLHGPAESGTDGKAPLNSGLGTAVKAREKKFPFFVVFPQSQEQTWIAGSRDANRALGILGEVEASYKTDPQRVYLTGMSLGGFGVWSLAAALPDRWAAIAPVCGGGNPKDAAKLKNIPCWCFHGDLDKQVPVKKSREMIEALKGTGALPRYSEFKGVDHNASERAYASTQLYEWMLKQKKQ